MGKSLIITQITPFPESKTPIVCSPPLKIHILKQHSTVDKTVFPYRDYQTSTRFHNHYDYMSRSAQNLIQPPSLKNVASCRLI